ncbi:MAG: sugar ABC transporter substrate-binding protein [Rhizobiaceae bacterium]|nr:sugar ABC transporter substrate-binding protein [Rhizobiaceae bacterium]
MKQILLASAVVLASTAGAFAADKFAVIMGNIPSANQFWAKVEQGALEKGKEMGIEVTVLGSPGGESDVAGQIALVEDQLTKGITGLALAPADPAALNPTVEKALKQGVKVVYIDRPGGVAGITYVGTDNEPAAALGGKYICDHIEKGSDVAILQGVMAIVNGSARAKGSRDALTACGMNIVAEQTAEWDNAKGQMVTENIITANPNLKALFASNDNMGMGAIEALKGAKMLDKVMVVGFDGNPEAAAAILKGEMAISIAQRPVHMGAIGVESLAKLIKGETLPPVVDTGAEIVDKSNAESYK